MDEPSTDPIPDLSQKRDGYLDVTYPVEMKELSSAIRNLKNGKAKGPHGLCFELIKEGGAVLTEYLQVWINSIFSEGGIDASANNGVVKLLFKKGDKFDPLNYRPITLSRILSKCFTKVLTRRITSTVEEEGLLAETQYGFRESRSTTQAVHVLSTLIQKAKVEGDDVHVAFVDLKSAYDRVSRKHLVEACRQAGFNENSISVVKSLYLADNICFEVNGVKSAKLFLKDGVRQGCQTSPVLFNLYLKSVIEIVQRSKKGVCLGDQVVTIIAFADDLAIIGRDAKACSQALSIAIQECDRIGMSVSKEKSKVMRAEEVRVPRAKGDVVPLEAVMSFMYLGAKMEINFLNRFQV